jgi:hypothetical protein
MAFLRLVGKAFLLATRSKKRFLMFTAVYAVVIALTAYFVGKAFTPTELLQAHPVFGQNSLTMLITIVCAMIMTMFYANIIVTNRKTEIATIKCLGWTSNHIRILISGEIFAVTLVAFIVVLEIFIHTTAILAFSTIFNQPSSITTLPASIVLVQPLPIVVTFGIILGVQILGILVANHKIFLIRPIQALQKM